MEFSDIVVEFKLSEPDLLTIVLTLQTPKGDRFREEKSLALDMVSRLKPLPDVYPLMKVSEKIINEHLPTIDKSRVVIGFLEAWEVDGQLRFNGAEPVGEGQASIPHSGEYVSEQDVLISYCRGKWSIPNGVAISFASSLGSSELAVLVQGPVPPTVLDNIRLADDVVPSYYRRENAGRFGDVACFEGLGIEPDKR